MNWILKPLKRRKWLPFVSISMLLPALWLGKTNFLDAQVNPGNQPAKNENNNNNNNQPVGANPKIDEEDIIRANFGMKRSGEAIQFELLNDFENCEDWRAKATSPLGETRVRKVEGRPGAQKDEKKPKEHAFDKELKMLQDYRKLTLERRRKAAERFAKEYKRPAPKKSDKSDDELAKISAQYILGVKTYFKDRGFDRVEVSPPNEYIIKGRAKEIRVWALGRKFRHTLYVKLRDYRGKTHKLKMGRLDFFGWKKMKVTIPGWLPQSSRYALLDKNLHFVSFFVESDRFDSPGTFYFYLDNFSIVTDTANNRYDGSEILDTW